LEKDRTKLKIGIAALLLVAFCFASISRLYNLQIVNGDYYRQQSIRRLYGLQTVEGVRGEIQDRYGRPLVVNRTIYVIRFSYSSWKKTEQNDVILRLVKIVDEAGQSYHNTLPVENGKWLRFNFTGRNTATRLESLNSVNERLGIPAVSTANEFMQVLYARYKLDNTNYTAGEKFTIAGIRYSMERAGFSATYEYTFAEDITAELGALISERTRELPGVEVEVDSVRSYETEYAAHILGRVGPIYKEEYEQYAEKGYAMNAIVGKDGIEKAMEDTLRGIDGTNTIETDMSGRITNVIEKQAAVAGSDVMLTIDIDLQQAAETALEKRILELREQNTKKGATNDAKGGAAVVVDVKSGQVLASANYPSYSLSTYSQDYNELLDDALTPLVNRAIAGKYAPGSTYKVAVAIAALEKGIITPSTTIYDQHKYTYYPGYQPVCGGWHGNVNVASALRVSCNYFFYDIGRRVGINAIVDYASRLGLGKKTGIELDGEVTGAVAGPEAAEAVGQHFYAGDTLAAAIGQSYNQFTPAQLANYIATVANGGTNYKLTLIKSVKDYSTGATISINEPVVNQQTGISATTINAVKEGMYQVAKAGTAAKVFADYPISIGAKTGSAETGVNGSSDGVFVCFAPYDDPQVAIAVVVEKGWQGGQVAVIARDILDVYFDLYNVNGERNDIGSLIK